MKEYTAHFSFYSELYGDFEDIPIKVEANDPFEARRAAWALSETDENLRFTSDIKLCGITWNASPLDLPDYFNSAAAYEKYRLRYIENVDIPNAKIKGDMGKADLSEREKCVQYGSLQTISEIAKDFGKAHGMMPPTIYEELYYARELAPALEKQGASFENISAFYKMIERAEKWDTIAMREIQDFLKNGYIATGEQVFNLREELAKDGICPTVADLDDGDYKYIRRWDRAADYKNIGRLPFFGENDVIADSRAMQYEYQILVLNKELLQPEFQTPINSLWQANQGSAANLDKSGSGLIAAENLFTSEVVEWKRSDFLGVLRPDIVEHIDYDKIKAEYLALNPERTADNNAEHEGDGEEMED